MATKQRATSVLGAAMVLLALGALVGNVGSAPAAPERVFSQVAGHGVQVQASGSSECGSASLLHRALDGWFHTIDDQGGV